VTGMDRRRFDHTRVLGWLVPIALLFLYVVNLYGVCVCVCVCVCVWCMSMTMACMFVDV
jgi:hypothetical protein